MPMIRRVPKRGFNNRWSTEVFAVNVGRLNDCFNEGEEVTLKLLEERHLAKGTFDEVKILGDGELTKKLTGISPPIQQVGGRKNHSRWRNDQQDHRQANPCGTRCSSEESLESSSVPPF